MAPSSLDAVLRNRGVTLADPESVREYVLAKRPLVIEVTTDLPRVTEEVLARFAEAWRVSDVTYRLDLTGLPQASNEELLRLARGIAA
jgi:hypothetical protein